MVFFLVQPGTYPSARKARLGNVPGYYLSSLPGLKRREVPVRRHWLCVDGFGGGGGNGS